jgi:hypothetical protein
MAVKIPTSYIARPFQIYPHKDFWFQNIPSGNTDYNFGFYTNLVQSLDRKNWILWLTM